MTPEQEQIINQKIKEVAQILYQNTPAEKDIELLTGIRVPHSTQHYLGLNDEMELKQMESEVEELSVDGGTVKIRTPLGQSGEWKQYKAIKVHQLGAGALYQEDEKLSDWVNQQPLAQ